MNSPIKEYVCRLCANPGVNYHPIFDEKTTDSILEKIHKCLPLVIDSNDKLPIHICNDCFEALEISDKLRTQCLLADSILRKQLTAIETVPLIENIKQEEDLIEIKTEIESLDTDFEDIQLEEEFIDIKTEIEPVDTSLEDIQQDEDSVDIQTENEPMDTVVEDIQVEEASIDIKTESEALDTSLEDIQQEESSIEIKTEIEPFDTGLKDIQQEKPSVEIKTENEPLERSSEDLHQKEDITNTKTTPELLEPIFDKLKTFNQRIDVCPGLVWICEVCKDEFNSSDDLVEHKNNKHNNNKSIEDTGTNDISENSDSLILRNILEEPLDIKEENDPCSENTPIVNEDQETADCGITHCDICNITIEDKYLMELHLKFHQPYSMYCNNCCRTYPSAYDLYIHQKNDHLKYPINDIKWFCENCERLTDNAKWAKRHINKCTKQRYKCKCCSVEFVYKNALILHEKNQHYETIRNDPNLKFKCELCDKSYFDRRNLRDHVREHQALKDGTYTCSWCAKIFPRSARLRKHIQEVHRKERKFTCDVCFKIFDNKCHMRQHRELHDKLACLTCDTEFDSVPLLDQHCLEQHNIPAPERKYYCNQCGENFQQKRLLKDHSNKHTGERPYVCQKCRKTFRTYAAYYAHRQTHTNLTFFCDHCKRKFSTKRSLVDHMPKHDLPENWRYNCEICQIKFPIFGLLLTHLKKYRHLHILNCDLCGIEVLGMHKLRKHKIQKHKCLTLPTIDCNKIIVVEKEQIT